MEAPGGTVRRAKALRKAMSLPEVLLWKQLRGRGLAGLYFRRQHPIGSYVLDFYCDAHKLAVEVDGSTHHVQERPEKDRVRDEWLEARGLRVLRLRAGLVLSDMDTALRMIHSAAKGD